MAMGPYESRLKARVRLQAAKLRSRPATPIAHAYQARPRAVRPSDLLLCCAFSALVDSHLHAFETLKTRPGVILLKVPNSEAAQTLLELGQSIMNGSIMRGAPVDPLDELQKASADQIAFVAEVDNPRDRIAAARSATLTVKMALSLVVLWYEDISFLPDEFQTVEWIELKLPDVTRTRLKWLGRTVTGRACPIPPGIYSVLTPRQVDLAFTFGLTVEECQRRLAFLVEARPSTELDNGPRLEDLHGYGAAKAWGLSLARDLKAYASGDLNWREVDRGALISGPPGVGKTTFVAALARSCGVPLISSSVAQWYATDHLGVTIQQIRALFASAAAKAPAILFIDEIDGLGDRNRADARHLDYISQIINIVLEEMDGIRGREGVVVIGATNHPGRVDGAVKRPGRLDREIEITLPGKDELAGIYRTHLEGELPQLDLQPLASISLGATGAHIESWVRGARRIARDHGRALQLGDLVEMARGSASSLAPDLLHEVAVHEAGHGFMAIQSQLARTVSLTIGERGNSMGKTLFERVTHTRETRETCLALARYILGGRAAEQVLLGKVSSAAGGADESDLSHATSLIAAAEASLGLGQSGSLIWLGEPDETRRLLSDFEVRRNVEKTLTDVYAEAVNVISDNQETVLQIATALQERLHLSSDEMLALCASAQRDDRPMEYRTSDIVRRPKHGRGG